MGRTAGQGCRIVTRLKKNTTLTFTRERLLPPGGPILSDRFGTLPACQASSRRNPMDAEMREVRVRIETGEVLRIFTNDLTSAAQEVADLYKRRWMIERAFCRIKDWRRIATRYDKLARNFAATVILAAIFRWWI